MSNERGTLSIGVDKGTANFVEITVGDEIIIVKTHKNKNNSKKIVIDASKANVNLLAVRDKTFDQRREELHARNT